jgi:hypothetical protein
MSLPAYTCSVLVVFWYERLFQICNNVLDAKLFMLVNADPRLACNIQGSCLEMLMLCVDLLSSPISPFNVAFL